MTTITQAEFLDTCKERFGPNPLDWAFICPNCKDVANGYDFVAALEAKPRARRGRAIAFNDLLGQECIGRSLGALDRPRGTTWTGRGCDWAAYGLIGGPLTVESQGQQIRSFHIAPAA